MLDNSLTLTAYAPRYRQDVLDLLYYCNRVQTHLDWCDVGQWLDSDEAIIRLVWADGRMVGVIGATTPLHNQSWLRVIGLEDAQPARPILLLLWDALAQALRAASCQAVALLVIDAWLKEYVALLGFAYFEEIVTLRRNRYRLPPPRPSRVNLRGYRPDDLAQIVSVDQAAFSPPWQMSTAELEQAQQIAALCTVAELDGEIVGYQLSTAHHQAGHLARLAVLPHLQGHGIGGALVDDLIRRFWQRGVRSITVNTQASNLRSQHLYRRYDFQRNNYDLQVWLARL